MIEKPTQMSILMVSFFFLVVGLMLTLPLAGQNLSDEGLRPYVNLWQEEQSDSLRALLPQVVTKFPGKPETLFFAAVYETNGEKAAADFLNIVTRFPDSYFADQSLFRLIQYDYALGQYKSADARVQEFERRYPKSALVEKARVFALTNSGGQSLGGHETTQPMTGGFTLQLGAFSQSRNAEDLKAKLVSSGYADALTGEKTVNGKKFYTVTWGSFSDKEQARLLGEKIKEKLKLLYSIVEK
jgi:hypothetical protein